MACAPSNPGSPSCATCGPIDSIIGVGCLPVTSSLCASMVATQTAAASNAATTGMRWGGFTVRVYDRRSAKRVDETPPAMFGRLHELGAAVPLTFGRRSIGPDTIHFDRHVC